MTDYYCNKCGFNIGPDDKVCPNCRANLSEVGRKITVVIEETIRLSSEVTAELTPAEKNFLDRFYDWLRKNWTIEQIEVGFPSGVKIVFKRRQR
jgi:RNA polymerase subunit RPABC4/transcription elongation factor Spt4